VSNHLDVRVRDLVMGALPPPALEQPDTTSEASVTARAAVALDFGATLHSIATAFAKQMDDWLARSSRFAHRRPLLGIHFA
jgi:hypothetical protein